MTVVVWTGFWTQLQGTVTDCSSTQSAWMHGPPAAPVGVQPGGVTVAVTVGHDGHDVSVCSSYTVLAHPPTQGFPHRWRLVVVARGVVQPQGTETVETGMHSATGHVGQREMLVMVGHDF